MQKVRNEEEARQYLIKNWQQVLSKLPDFTKMSDLYSKLKDDPNQTYHWVYKNNSRQSIYIDIDPEVSETTPLLKAEHRLTDARCTLETTATGTVLDVYESIYYPEAYTLRQQAKDNAEKMAEIMEQEHEAGTPEYIIQKDVVLHDLMELMDLSSEEPAPITDATAGDQTATGTDQMPVDGTPAAEEQPSEVQGTAPTGQTTGTAQPATDKLPIGNKSHADSYSVSAMRSISQPKKYYTSFINDAEVLRTLAYFKPAGTLFEIRMIHGKDNFSGYFTNPAAAVEALHNMSVYDKRYGLSEYNIYFVINDINRACYARSQQNHFEYGVSNTSDTDITHRSFFYIDFDPVRPSGTSSSEQERAAALHKAKAVRDFLKEQGFSDPVLASSGNGYHLMYMIDMPATAESKEIISKLLTNIDTEFRDNEAAEIKIDIDQTVINEARICKLYGTKSHKGISSEEDGRIHRFSEMIDIPDQMEVTPTEVIKRLNAKLQPAQPVTDSRSGRSDRRTIRQSAGEFDLKSCLNNNNIEYKEKAKADGTVMYELSECLFYPDHGAVIFQDKNGKLGYSCLHNRCKDKHWHDARLVLDPDAYSYKSDYDRIDSGYQHHKELKSAAMQPMTPAQPAAEQGKKSDIDSFIEKVQTDSYKQYQTGLEFFDNLLSGGVMPETLILLTAAPAAGKTTLAQTIAETMADHQRAVLYINLEMSKEQMLAKALSMRMSRKGDLITSTEIMQGFNWSDDQRQKVLKAAEEYKTTTGRYIKYKAAAGIDQNDCLPCDIEAIEEYIENTAAQIEAKGLPAPAVILDYLHLVKSEQKLETQDLLKLCVVTLKNYAIRHHTFVLAITAASRAASKGRLDADSGRDSSNLEYTGDYMLSLNYDEIDNGHINLSTTEGKEKLEQEKREEFRRMILRVDKNRFGRSDGYSQIYFDSAHNLYFGKDEFISYATSRKAFSARKW